MKKEIKKWNKLNPDNSIKESDFNNFFCFQKMVYRIGVEQFIANFPYVDHRRNIIDGTTTDEYIYDGIGRIFVYSVDNSGRIYPAQKFFKIKKFDL